MGRYKRKPHKKQRVDYYHHKKVQDEIEDELDIFFNKKQDESVLFLSDGPMLFEDEPSIVKQLRNEELNGKLPMWLADFNKEENDETVSETPDSTKDTFSKDSELNNQHVSGSKKFK
jgi:hypothetical protein